jgi:uncharacterized protein YfaT (DUF1175 family)
MKVRIKQVPNPQGVSERWDVEFRHWFVWLRFDYFRGDNAKGLAMDCAQLLKHPPIEEVK